MKAMYLCFDPALRFPFCARALVHSRKAFNQIG